MLVPRTFIEKWLPNRGLKMLFIHTPKCGGSAIAQAFGRHFRKCPSVRHPKLKGHLTWVEYRDRLLEIGDPISNFVTFSVVRNPFDWHVSWFNYIKRQDPKKTGYAVEHQNFQTFQFSDYVTWLHDKSAPRTPRHDMGRSLSDWTCNEHGEIAVSQVIRQETLLADLEKLQLHHNLMLRLPHERVNAFREHNDYRSSYSDQDADVIAKRHANDCKLFGYSFDGPTAR